MGTLTTRQVSNAADRAGGQLPDGLLACLQLPAALAPEADHDGASSGHQPEGKTVSPLRVIALRMFPGVAFVYIIGA